MFCLGIRSFAGRFKAMNHQSSRLCLQMQQVPVEGGDFNAAARRSFQFGGYLNADNVFKTSGASPQVKAYGRERQQEQSRGHSKRKMAKEETS
jgi:hypothetical protein